MQQILTLSVETPLVILYVLLAAAYACASMSLAAAGHKEVARCYLVIAMLHVLIAAFHLAHEVHNNAEDADTRRHGMLRAT